MTRTTLTLKTARPTKQVVQTPQKPTFHLLPDREQYDLLKTIGTVDYDPHRANMKRNTNNWVVINCDREITRYYRWWLEKELHIRLNQPSWDAHISVVRGERISQDVYDDMWKRQQGRKVNIEYEHGQIYKAEDLKNGGWFYWLRARCAAISEVRDELGLPVKYPNMAGHITIGRSYY